MTSNAKTYMKPNAALDTTPEPCGVVDATRRRLFKTGIAAAPVVLTLASRPVLAAQCKTPSAAMSANLSRPQGQNVSGTQTISQWIVAAGPPANWPSSYPPTTQFRSSTVSAVFGSSTKYGNSATLLDVLKSPNPATTPQSTQLDKDLIVALLNRTSVSAAAQCISLSDLNKMFVNGPNGTYEPTAGVLWGSAQIHTYLLNNGLLG